MCHVPFKALDRCYLWPCYINNVKLILHVGKWHFQNTCGFPKFTWLQDDKASSEHKCIGIKRCSSCHFISFTSFCSALSYVTLPFMLWLCKLFLHAFLSSGPHLWSKLLSISIFFYTSSLYIELLNTGFWTQQLLSKYLLTNFLFSIHVKHFPQCSLLCQLPCFKSQSHSIN